ncbi:MAG: S-layer homology domain-containing protein [Clostridia bacterium]|nr:S-layer homology domain-containing protein [Clostridia bacterium]
MKKFLKIALVAALMLACFTVLVNAALTKDQQNAVYDFAEKFTDITTSQHKITYGGGGDFAPPSYQLKTVYINANYYTINGVRKKLVTMVNPAGYPTYRAYYQDLGNATGGFIIPGNYLILDCTAYVSFIMKGALGMRFDYCVANHLSAWTTELYMKDQYASIRKVIDKNGKEIDLFEKIYESHTDEITPLADRIPANVMSKLQVGDIVVGRNDSTELGHIMIYAGDGCVWHSSSEPYYNPDGVTIAGRLQRKESISKLLNDSYTWVQVLRINDGVLDPDFTGYTMDYNIDTLNNNSSNFDTKYPELVKIEGKKATADDERITLNIEMTDEFGDARKVYQAGTTKVLVHNSAPGESGVLSYCLSKSASIDTNPQWTFAKDNLVITKKSEGKYYLWIRDAAENVSPRYTINVSSDGKVTYTCDKTAYNFPSQSSKKSITNYTNKNTYKQGMFRDVAATAWYTSSVKGAYELGFMLGTDAGDTFAPTKNLTMGELMALVARVHNIYNGGNGVFGASTPWYDIYVDYAVQNGIIKNGEFSNMTAYVTRAQMAYLFAKVLPESEYTVINANVTSVPDVNSKTPYADYILKLYRSGLVAGKDGGLFAPIDHVSRSEIAAIITRLAIPATRMTVNF